MCLSEKLLILSCSGRGLSVYPPFSSPQKLSHDLGHESGGNIERPHLKNMAISSFADKDGEVGLI